MQKKSSICLLLSLLFVLLFHIVVQVSGFSLGSIYKPTPEHAYIMLQWGLWGTFSAIFLVSAFLQEAQVLRGIQHVLFKTTRTKFILYSSLFALVLVVAIRFWIFRCMPVTDDEACYDFMSKVLASGRLKAISHPARLFFDHIFMVNNGEIYSQYFIGWPALLVLDKLLGSLGLLNAVFAALTVPLFHAIAQKIVGSKWARVAVALFATAPLILLGAATTLSHTATMFFLCAALAAFLKAVKSNAALYHVFFIFSASLAFFIRPYSALAFLLPLVVWWLWVLIRNPEKAQLAKRGPAILLGIAMVIGFFAILHFQTGNFLTTPYKAYENYSAQNEYRFSIYQPDAAFSHIQINPLYALDQLACGLLRMNFALFGWPCSLLFILFAHRSTRTTIPWVCLLSFLAFNSLISDPGIDTYGPTHYSELSIAIILLTAAGMRRISILLAKSRHIQGFANFHNIPIALCIALTATAWMGYIPQRLTTIRAFSSLVYEMRSLASAPKEKSVLFVSDNASNYAITGKGRGFVFARPCNDPDMKNHVLWANHLTAGDDRKLMASFFPDRNGYVMMWEENKAYLIPLEKLPDNFPDNRGIGGSNNSIDWSKVELNGGAQVLKLSP